MFRFQACALAIGLTLSFSPIVSATVLFDSHGFEPSANPTINYFSNIALIGQPVSALPQNAWTGTVQAGNPSVNSNVPLSGVFSYVAPVGGNTQYALLQSPNVTPGSYGRYFPKTNLSVPEGGFGNYIPAPGETVDVNFTMNVYGGYGSNAFFGVSAYSGAGAQIASVGINNSTGALVLPAGATMYNGGFTAPFDAFTGYKLSLDYATQTASIYTALVGTNGVAGTYTLRASFGFAAAASNFASADLTSVPLGSTNASGYAAFDNYSVVTPEPASLTLVAAAATLVGRRRRV